MGGCCCSSRKPQLHGTPLYYYCPPSLEEHDSLTSHHSAITAGFLVDINLDTSSPDTYRPPPPPIPFDVVLGYPQSIDSDSVEETICDGSFAKSNYMNRKESECNVEAGRYLASPRKFGVENLKSKKLTTTEEEDVCPTCLEEYDVENPRIVTKCNHHFHLSCILEWMERCDTCPICSQEMEFEAL